MNRHSPEWFLDFFGGMISGLDVSLLTQNSLEPDPIPEGGVVFAIGKASRAMTEGAERAGVRITKGIVVSPPGGAVKRSGGPIDYLNGDHPIPGSASFRAGECLLGAIEKLPRGVDVLALISGGGSALLAAPPLGIVTEVKRLAHRALVHSGLPISKVNTVRRHFSAIKGGLGLSRILDRGGRVRVLGVSDVAGDVPHDIGSGIFVPDPTTFSEAHGIARKIPGFPPEALDYLESGTRGEVPETPKPDTIPSDRWSWKLVAGMETSRSVAAERLKASGEPVELPKIELGDFFTALRRGDPGIFDQFPQETWILVSGENEIEIPRGRKPGLGGRASHSVLELGIRMEKLGLGFECAMVATDGVDGNSELGGGFLQDGDLPPEKLREAGEALTGFNSAGFLKGFGRSFPGNPSGTNFGDLLAFRWRSRRSSQE